MRITYGKLGLNLNPVFSRPLLGLTLAAALVGVACGGSTSSTPGTGGSSSPGAGGNSGGGTSGGNSGGGTTGSGGGTGGSAAGNTGSAGNGPGGNGGTGGNSVGAGGNSTGGSAGAGTAGSSGGNVGTGGNATGGSAGTGGAGTGGAGAGGKGGGGAGTGGATGSGGTGGGASACTCPANATFCSDFETNALPTGAVYKVNAAPGDWSRDFQVDGSQHKCGSSSLRVKQTSEAGSSGSAYRMLAVPASTGAFWVRFYVRSAIDMGGDHNAFAKASESDDPNSSVNIEFAEDVGIAFNTNDSVVWPTGYGRLTSGGTNPYVLTSNTWRCVEISYDSANRVQQLYVDGAQLINATNYPATVSSPIKIFKFGFQNFHGPDRTMWYDSVAVAPTRIGCN